MKKYVKVYNSVKKDIVNKNLLSSSLKLDIIISIG